MICPVTEGYGLTETSVKASTNAYGDKVRLGTVGVPVPEHGVPERSTTMASNGRWASAASCVSKAAIDEGYWNK
jgi:long-chain acyl-CoA synthetase